MRWEIIKQFKKTVNVLGNVSRYIRRERSCLQPINRAATTDHRQMIGARQLTNALTVTSTRTSDGFTRADECAPLTRTIAHKTWRNIDHTQRPLVDSN